MLKKISALLLCILSVSQILISAVLAQSTSSAAARQDSRSEHLQSDNQQNFTQDNTQTSQMPQRPQYNRSSADYSDDTDEDTFFTQNPGMGRPEKNSGDFGGGMQPHDMGVGLSRGENIPQQQEATQQTNDLSSSFSLINVIKEYKAAFVSLILLAFAFIFVIFYKRKTF